MERNEFNHYAATYSETVEGSINRCGAELDYFTRRKADILLNVVSRHHGAPQDLRFLDVGCGVGNTDRHLVARVGHLLGLDTADEATNVAAETNPDAEYRVIDGDQLPVDDQSVDVAFAINVMHHVDPEDRPAFVADLHRVIRPGGLVAVFEHNPYNPLTRLSVLRCEFDDGVVLQSRRKSRQLLADVGFEPVELGYIIFSPFDWSWTIGLEDRLTRLPLGAQHYVAARRPKTDIDPHS